MILTVGLWILVVVVECCLIFFFFCGFDGCGSGDGGCCGYGFVVRCLIFFFFPCGFGCLVVVVVVGVVVGVADGRGGYG